MLPMAVVGEILPSQALQRNGRVAPMRSFIGVLPPVVVGYVVRDLFSFP